MAAAINRQAIGQWAAREEIVIVKLVTRLFSHRAVKQEKAAGIAIPAAFFGILAMFASMSSWSQTEGHQRG